MTALPVPAARHQLATLDQLAAIPEEEIWLAKQKSRQTRRAYKLDVRHFMRAFDITTTDELRQVDHRAVIAWERMQREQDNAKSSTIRRRLAALSSLFKHLVRHGVVARNPVVDVERPTINRIEGRPFRHMRAESAAKESWQINDIALRAEAIWLIWFMNQLFSGLSKRTVL